MIRLAVDHTLFGRNEEECERDMRTWIGSDVSCQATLAVVLGFFVRYDGDVKKTVLSCVNVGGDTDTCACIAGSLTGAYKGFHCIDENWVKTMKKANPSLHLERLAELWMTDNDF